MKHSAHLRQHLRLKPALDCAGVSRYFVWFGIVVLCTLHLFSGTCSAQQIQAAAGAENQLQVQDHLQEVVRLGEAIVQNTKDHPLSRAYVGNGLQCRSCHLDNGKHPQAGTFLGSATAYPAWSPREQRVITLEDRVLNCFMRSCNGTRPPLGSEVSVAVTTYITSLSNGLPMRMNPSRPIGPGGIPPLSIRSDLANAERGAAMYAQRCAECHQADGQGNEDNPPVWGPRSYNDGAGLSSVDTLASWLKQAMPLDATDLTEQESLDISAYVNSHDRPRFDLESHLPNKEHLGEYNGSRKQ